MNLVSAKAQNVAAHYYPSEREWIISQLQGYSEYMSEFMDDEREAESYERFCLAILKIGKSSKEKIIEAIELGKMDYRDLLVSAGFGNSVTVHNDWARKVLGEKI